MPEKHKNALKATTLHNFLEKACYFKTNSVKYSKRKRTTS